MSSQSFKILNPSIAGFASTWEDSTEVDDVNTISTAANSTQSPPKPRKRKAPTLRDSDWQPHKSRISELYTNGMTLKDIVRTMETETGFHAEPRQYKFRISQWKLDKNIKRKEMQALVRKRQWRKHVESDKPELIFKVRGNEIEASKIDRWMQAHDVSESTVYAPSSASSTPSAVSCRTDSIPNTPHFRSSSPLSSAGSSLSTSISSMSQSQIMSHPLHLPDAQRATPHQSSENLSAPPTLRLTRGNFGLTGSQVSQLQVTWRAFLLRLFQVPSPAPVIMARLNTFKVQMNVYLGQCNLLPHLGRIFKGCNEDILSHLRSGRMISSASGPALKGFLDYFSNIGCYLECHDPMGESPLLSAIACFNEDIVKYMSLLMGSGANIHAVDYMGRGALHVALILFDSMHNTLSVMETPKWKSATMVLEMKLVFLLEKGCDPEAKDNLGKTPADYAHDDERIWRIWTRALARSKKVWVLQAVPNPMLHEEVIWPQDEPLDCEPLD